MEARGRVVAGLLDDYGVNGYPVVVVPWCETSRRPCPPGRGMRRVPYRDRDLAVSALNAAAKAALRDAGVTQAEWARHWFPCNAVPSDPSTEIGRPVWLSDACGCPDDRCKDGHHHDPHEDCGCLPVVLGQYLTDRARLRQQAVARHGPYESMTGEYWRGSQAGSRLHAP